MLSLNKNWNSLIKPSNIEYNHDRFNPNTLIAVIEPLERGFGLTIGNALRRVLLSSIRGAAITAVKIPGILHEFSSISGVKEDVVDVILNLKSVIVKMHTDDKKVVKLRVEGPCKVTAGMIETVSDVEILNPEQLICTLSANASLEMDLFCEVGKGFVPIDQFTEDNQVGVISIDALFNPVRRVSYKIENARVGQVTDYDKLLLTVETNGSILPEVAIALAARILQSQFQLFINFEEEEVIEQKEQVSELPFNPLLLKKIDELELSVRSHNCFKNDNIVYLGDLIIKTEAEMLKTQNFGRKSLNEIKNILSGLNLTFGMDVPGWPPDNLETLSKKYEDPY